LRSRLRAKALNSERLTDVEASQSERAAWSAFS
jgi:hypothetical protein